MGNFFEDLLGKPKVTPIWTAAPEEVGKAEKKMKRTRSALLSTEGGIAGQEIMTGGVGFEGNRNTLFRN